MTITEFISIGTLTISFLLLLFNAKKLLFVNVITKERIKYIENLRNVLAEFISQIEYNATKGDEDKSENNHSLIKNYNYLKLLLNPDNEIDKLILSEIESLYNSFNNNDKNILHKCRIFSIMSQRIIHFEWKGIQNETKYFSNKSKFTSNFLRMIRKSIPSILFLFPLCSFSQITIGSVEKREPEIIEQKPIPYDSLQNYKVQEDLINYKMYIGQKIYLPKFNNFVEGSYSGEGFFMFSDSLVKLEIEESKKLEKLDRGGYPTNVFYKYIYTYKYKPLHFGSNIVNGDPYASIETNADEVSDRYYTVIDVYLGEECSILLSKMRSLIKIEKEGYFDNDIHKIYYTFNIKKVFKIQDDISKEKFYVFGLDNFILVSYFLKQKEIFNSKKVVAIVTYPNETTDYSNNEKFIISNKSVWNCEVTLLSKKEISGADNIELGIGSYFIAYKLTNEKGQIAIFEELNDEAIRFEIYDEYIKKENDKKLQQEQLIAKRKEINQIETEKRIEKEREFLNRCITMYGEYYGNLIFNRNVVIGMTKEMCEMAWGKPFEKSTIITENVTKELWYYSWKKNLHFENGKLIRIEK